MMKRERRTLRRGNWHFYEIQLRDLEVYSKYIQRTEYPVSVWSSNFPYLWASSKSSDKRILWKVVDGLLVTFMETKYKHLHLMCLPYGPGDINEVFNVIKKCLSFCRRWNGGNVPTIVRTINEEQLSYLQQSRGIRLFKVKELGGIERHYNVDLVLRQEGKDFAGVRRKVNKFYRLYPGVVIRHYQEKDFPALVELDEYWRKTTGTTHPIVDGSYYKKFIKYHQELKQIVLVAEIEGKVIGMCSGGSLPNGEGWCTLRKAMYEYEGLTYILLIAIAKEIQKEAPTVKLINDGSDMGVDGLRQFKESFKPVKNFRRYQLVIR